jgi:hypothetical protein
VIGNIVERGHYVRRLGLVDWEAVLEEDFGL